MDLTLYVIPGSHPCATVMGALDRKGLEYKRVDLLPGLSPLQQKLNFGKRTVPGLKIGHERVAGSRLILKALEGLVPDPPLYPSDPDARRLHDEAELWGDDVLQESVRWFIVNALARAPEAAETYLAGAKLPKPPNAVLKLGFKLEMRALGRDDEYVRQELAALPRYIERIDAWIADGVLGGDAPTAADFQIAASLRLMLTIADIAPLVEGTAAGDLARRLFPDYAGHVPAGTLPAGWVPALPASTPAAA